MTAQPYSSARLKLKQSARHIDSLSVLITSYSGARIVPELDEPGRLTWTMRITEDPTDEIQGLTGDAIHNLRAALDHTAVEAVKLNGRNTNGVYFPFAENAGELDTMIKQRKFHRASADAVALVRRLEPFKGGNAALRAIHDLDVADKHHSLVALKSMARQRHDFSMAGAFFSNNSFGMEDGARAISVPFIAGMTLQPIEVNLVASIAQGQPLGGSELLPTLARLHKLTEGIVEAFAALP